MPEPLNRLRWAPPRRAWLLVAALGAVLLALFGPRLAHAATGATTVAAVREVPEIISADGVVEAVRQTTLAAQVAGQVVELSVQVGDRVRAGQVLARIDPRTAEQAFAASQSQLLEAQAQLASAQRAWQRSEQLHAQKFLSKAALEQAELDLKAAQARVGVMQAGAGQAGTARTLAVIRAPYAGVVGARHVELGDMATPGKPLLTVFDPHDMRVAATLAQASLRRVQLQAPAAVELAPGAPALAARRVTLLPTADARTHSATVRLDLGAAPGLLPGQFARALFAGVPARRLVIPEVALLRRSELTAVYVQGAGGAMLLRQVRPGSALAGGQVEILAGLRAGEVIALDPVAAGMGRP